MNPKEVKANGPFVFFYSIDLYLVDPEGKILVQDFSQHQDEINGHIKDKAADVLVIDILDRVEYTFIAL